TTNRCLSRNKNVTSDPGNRRRRARRKCHRKLPPRSKICVTVDTASFRLPAAICEQERVEPIPGINSPIVHMWPDVVESGITTCCNSPRPIRGLTRLICFSLPCPGCAAENNTTSPCAQRAPDKVFGAVGGEVLRNLEELNKVKPASNVPGIS